jgi:Peptidase family C25
LEQFAIAGSGAFGGQKLRSKIMSDKIVVTNYSALHSKYGAVGVKQIRDALKRLAKADSGRHLKTRIIAIDDTAQMKACKGKAVSAPSAERETKAAIDAIFKTLKPAYMVLLGAGDVVCHIKLGNAVNTDGDDSNDDDDATVPSDLPYASDAAFSRDTAKYLGPTRVIGRLPDIEGGKDASVLVKLLDVAAKSKPRPRADYAKAFAITATVWKNSTAESVENIFGAGQPVVNSPPPGHPGINGKLASRSWFINCHGARSDPKFYGEGPAGVYADAMESAKLKGKVTNGTVAAAECCYGAELYDPQLAQMDMPICNQALLGGAMGFLGSTTIAYGPADGNGAADLITQFFMMRMLDGASLGRALLQARHEFIKRESMSDPVNLKTLAQFLLLGDPSLQACAIPAAGAKTVDGDIAIVKRRMLMASQGKALQSAATFPVRLGAKSRKAPGKAVSVLAQRHGYNISNAVRFKVSGGAEVRAEMKSRKYEEQVLLVTKSKPIKGSAQRQVSVLVARMHGNAIISYKEYGSR